MNYPEMLEKLDRLKVLAENYNRPRSGDVDAHKALERELASLYGELEGVFEKYLGKSKIDVDLGQKGIKATYSNYFEAGFLSRRTFYSEQGYVQLLKIIGRVKQAANSPGLPRDERSIGTVVEILNRFRQCCQYVVDRPSNERAVQDIVWIMLRSRFDRLDRENTLQKFGVKSYRPDFGIPELGLLVEVKYVGEATRPTDIQEEALADVPGYLQDQTGYRSIIVFVYDAAQKLRDPKAFIDCLKRVEGIVDVLVVPGIGQ